MPDAGLTAEDPRSGWYTSRPQFPQYPGRFDPLKRQQELAMYWKRRYETLVEMTGAGTEWDSHDAMAKADER